MEVWKSVEGYSGMYEVSNLGNIKSIDRKNSRGYNLKGLVLKQWFNSQGYLCVDLTKNNKAKKLRVHRLVAFAFCTNHFEGAQVNHIDENKHNNHFSNLEWCTSKENCYHSRFKRAESIRKYFKDQKTN